MKILKRLLYCILVVITFVPMFIVQLLALMISYCILPIYWICTGYILDIDYITEWDLFYTPFECYKSILLKDN